MFNVREVDLARLNSATKYPSIPTYHTIADKGLLQDACIAFDGEVFVTEKVDGTNSRIVVLPDGDYFIGSREELLTYRHDLVFNPSMGIVPIVRSLAEQLGVHAAPGELVVFYVESYGKGIGAGARNYAKTSTGHRLFDVARVPLDVLNMPPEEISRWRESGGQTYATVSELKALDGMHGLQLVPYVASGAGLLPAGIPETLAWLEATLATTRVALDDGVARVPEGVVVRTHDRRTIAKVRYEDYHRTLRRRR